LLTSDTNIASFTESATQNITIHQRYLPLSRELVLLELTILSLYSGVVLAKVVEYLAYKQQYANTPSNQVMEDFSDRIEPELALEL
jgi:transcription elongation factor B subunit 1